MGNCCSKTQPKTTYNNSYEDTYNRKQNTYLQVDGQNDGVGAQCSISRRQNSHISDRLLVVAIDVGTTFTGYAYSFCHDYNLHHLKMYTHHWTHDKGISEKAPTAILLAPSRKMLSFGYDALRDYAELAENGNHQSHYFFHKFKMILYEDQNISIHTTILDYTGKKMPALAVFSELLKYLKDHVIKELQKRDNASPINKEDIHWVVTVPAIWNDKAKCFMRRAMNEAGIEDGRSTLALEPEAASLYCKYIPVHDTQAKLYQHFQSGTRYMVVDLGGGTVDVTIHSVKNDGTLEELHQPSGGCWGGTTVDKEFRSVLKVILQNEVYKKIQIECADDLLELDTNFEIKKHEYKINEGQKVQLRFPARIGDLYNETMKESIQQRLSSCKYRNEITLKRDKWVISPVLYQGLFTNSIMSISSHIEELLAGPVKDVHCILLVGGYSMSQIVSSELVKRFPNIRFIKPEEPWLAVMKGAVLFGHHPQAISARVCRRTYGIAIQTRFDASIHDINHRVRALDGYGCDDVFDVHLKIGEVVKINEKRQAKSYFVPPDSKYAVLDVYTSTDVHPKYVTDTSCSKLGSIVIEFDEITVRGDQVDVTLNYCGTELSVDAREQRTGKTTSAQLDFVG